MVVLLTQRADDIPFDLKHRPHTVYGGSIDKLRADLTARLAWAIEESRRRGREGAALSRLSVSLLGVQIPEISLGMVIPEIGIEMPESAFRNYFGFHVRNEGHDVSEAVSHVYLFIEDDSPFIPMRLVPVTITSTRTLGGSSPFTRSEETSRVTEEYEDLEALRPSEADKAKLGLPRQFSLQQSLPPIPPGAVELLKCGFKKLQTRGTFSTKFCLRLHTRASSLDLPFQLIVTPEKPDLPRT